MWTDAWTDTTLAMALAAAVERKQDATNADLLAYCRAGLASFKVPRQIRFVDDWPMSGTGKIQKFLLAEQVQKEGAWS